MEGREADARSDIFSLGAVLYEMTTGRRAFGGKSAVSVAAAILEKEPEPIKILQPMTPRALEREGIKWMREEQNEREKKKKDMKEEGEYSVSQRWRKIQ